MNEEQKLRETIEANLRLGILHTKDVGSKVGERMDGLSSKMKEIAHSMDLLADEMRATGREIRQDFDGLAEHHTRTLDLIHSMDDPDFDVRQEIEDLKRRVSELENRAS